MFFTYLGATIIIKKLYEKTKKQQTISNKISEKFLDMVIKRKELNKFK